MNTTGGDLLFRAAFEQNAMAMAQLSPSGEWLAINAQLCAVTGYSMEELHGIRYTQLYTEADKEEIAALLSKMTPDPQVSRTQRQLSRKDGSPTWVRELLAPVTNDSNELVCISLTLKDIDEEKATEAALAYRNKELDTFIYRASHDLRGPVATLLGLTDIAILDTEDETAKEYFDNCREVTRRMEKTIYDLLAVTEVKKSKTSMMSVLPREIVYRTMHDQKHKERLPLTDLDIAVDDNVVYYTDAAMLGIIITQVLDNALIFRRNEGRHNVSISIGGSESIIKIVVADNGCGIPASEHDLIFDLYYRGGNNHTGSGIGLYLVKAAVEKLAGSIRVSSTPGTGTDVHVYLPNTPV
ncbi:hypothetical protein GCM10023093_11560 [Nemorincola caseinilytica]|uniref:histidine kinase n=2 Tax=Nemorincola caseinilytica TaxID=2054315 RepID=A0ABP8NC08_9BACT